jgi:OOP family OmpA-OmpF porin
MKTHMKVALNSAALGLGVLAGLPGSTALAEDSGWYAGINGGVTRTTIDEERITSSLLSSGFTVTDFSEDDSERGYKLFGGYQFSRNFAIEGGYFDLGSYGFTAETQPSGTLTGNIEVTGLNLDLVALLPVGERFSLFGRAGANRAEASDTFSGTGLINVPNPSRSQRDTNLKVGVGVQWAFSDRIAARLEAERYQIDDAVGNTGDIDLYSLNLLMRLGENRQRLTSTAASARIATTSPQRIPCHSLPPSDQVQLEPGDDIRRQSDVPRCDAREVRADPLDAVDAR